VKASTELTSGFGARARTAMPMPERARSVRAFRNDLSRSDRLVNLCRRCDKQFERLTRIDSPHHANGHIRREPSDRPSVEGSHGRTTAGVGRRSALAGTATVLPVMLKNSTE
jgi:hypothetical protein